MMIKVDRSFFYVAAIFKTRVLVKQLSKVKLDLFEVKRAWYICFDKK